MSELLLQVVVETPGFIRQAQRCMDDGLLEAFINFIAANPMSGDIS